jgi:hypothetical protein
VSDDPDEDRPWRHATRIELRNMVHTATRRWEKAIKDGEAGRAALIRRELEPVNLELDTRSRR